MEQLGRWRSPNDKPTRRPSSNTWVVGDGPTDWIWNGWNYNAWTGDGWNGKQKFPTRMPTSHPTTSKPISHPPTSTPTSHPTTTTSKPISHPPTSHPTTSKPISHPPTRTPTSHPTTSKPISHPPTSTPTSHPTTSTPTKPSETPIIISGSPSTHQSEVPTIDSSNAPSMSISGAPSTLPSESTFITNYPSMSISGAPSTLPSELPTIDSSNAPSISISAAPSTHPSESPSPSFAPSVHPSISSFPSISPSASSEPSASTSTSPSSAPNISYYVAAQSGSGSNVVFELPVWPPLCSLSEEECKLIFCDGVRNTLQKKFCTDGPGGEYPPCNVGVTCDPEELGGTADRAVIPRSFPYTIAFSVVCTDAQCTDQTGPATQAADTLAALNDSLDTITNEEYDAGVNQALASLNPPADVNQYFTTIFFFQYDPTTSTMTILPVTQPVQADVGNFDLVGMGYCENSFGKKHAYIGYLNGSGIGNAWTTSQGCLFMCKNSNCLNSQGLILRGVTHGWELDPYSACYCLVDGLKDTGTSDPVYPASNQTACADVDYSSDDYGSGPVVNVDGTYGYHLCFRPKSI